MRSFGFVIVAAVGIILVALSSWARAEEPAEDLQAAVDDLVAQLAGIMEKNALTGAAIMDLVNLDTSASDLGRHVTEGAIRTLQKMGKFTVIERDFLEQTLKKLKLTAQDLDNPAKVQLLAKALNVRALVRGTVNDVGETVEFNTWVVRVTDRKPVMIAVALSSVIKNDRVVKLLGQGRPQPPPEDRKPTARAGLHLPKEMKIDLGEGVVIEMVLILPGEFDMGSPVTEKRRGDDEQMHRVRITKPFYIGKYEVTQDLWMAIMKKNPSEFRELKAPVGNVCWEDCQSFTARLNSMVVSGGFRLPTEAEWEYACRAGSKTAYCFGDDESKLAEYAWYFPNSGDTTHVVGLKKPNAWGLYDMHGNVWEWVQDWYGEYHPPAGGIVEDPTGPRTGGGWALRGGCWAADAKACRSACRAGFGAHRRFAVSGLRLAREPK